MNRRGFIAKALAGIAAIPLLSRIAQAKPQLPPVYKGPVEYGEVRYVLGRPPMSFAFCKGPVTRAARITVSRPAAERIDPERDCIQVNDERYEIVGATYGLEETTFELRQLCDSSSSTTV